MKYSHVLGCFMKSIQTRAQTSCLRPSDMLRTIEYYTDTHFRFSPQCNGMVERHNRTLLDRLAIFAQDHESEWDAYISLVTMAYHTAVHDATNFTPAYLMFGHELRTLLTSSSVSARLHPATSRLGYRTISIDLRRGWMLHIILPGTISRGQSASHEAPV